MVDMTTVVCKHLQSHDTCGLVFPLRVWLYGNIQVRGYIYSPFFLLTLVLQTCAVL